MKILRIVVVVALALASTWVSAHAGSQTLLGVGGPSIAAPSYTGPGDVTPGALAWYSCSRAYTAAYAAGAGSMCDLRRVSDNATCTVKAATNGFADLASNLCNGATQTINAFCTTGGSSCTITKMYDQSGGTNCAGPAACHLVSAGAIQEMPFAFSCIGANPCADTTAGVSPAAIELSSPNFTRAQPFTVSWVSRRTANTTTFVEELGAVGQNVAVGHSNSANAAMTFGGSVLSGTASDAAFHAVQSVFNGGASDVYVDGTPNTGAGGATGWSAAAISIPRGGLIGFNLMEGGIWPGAWNPTQGGTMNTNQHGTSGYNF